jgi:potassium-transporting ATPase potassium-binding subunit
MVWILPILIVVLTMVLSIPTGFYLAWLMDGRYNAPAWLRWIESRLDAGSQKWRQYALALVLFNTVMFVFGYLVLALQPYMPLNQLPDAVKAEPLAPTTIFNTVTSFLTNTNLQDYSGEAHLTYFSQIFFVVWNMFVSAAVGFCTLAAITRGLRGDKLMGNFYHDMWRVVMYVFLPFSVVTAVPLMAAGVPMTFESAESVATLDGGAVQNIARGPVAAILPIKHLGANGGGFFGANSAHPFENPNGWTNILEEISLMIFPFSLVVMFGRMLKHLRHAAVIYGVMLLMLAGMIGWSVYWDALKPNPGFTAHPAVVYNEKDPDEEKRISVDEVAALPVDQAETGNLEGKELRFGRSAGATFAATTTAIACGSVNCMHDSLNPMAGLTPFTGMWLNCIFGGKGVGLVNLLVYLIVGVFLSGLMVGRTPEYLGKKVEAREMKLAMLALLIHPIMILGPTGLFSAFKWGTDATSNPGAHGFSQILYQFSSSSANNGSGFEGLGDAWGFNEQKKISDADSTYSAPVPSSPYYDIVTGLVMLFGRFIPIIAPLALAASLAAKKPTPFTAGTLRTDTLTFGFVILGTILLVGALLFMPAAVLGPVAEHFGPMPFGN